MDTVEKRVAEEVERADLTAITEGLAYELYGVEDECVTIEEALRVTL